MSISPMSSRPCSAWGRSITKFTSCPPASMSSPCITTRHSSSRPALICPATPGYGKIWSPTARRSPNWRRMPMATPCIGVSPTPPGTGGRPSIPGWWATAVRFWLMANRPGRIPRPLKGCKPMPTSGPNTTLLNRWVWMWAATPSNSVAPRSTPTFKRYVHRSAIMWATSLNGMCN